MEDVAPAVSYYRFNPPDLGSGIYSTPFFGEVFTGRVVEVRPADLFVIANDPNWEKATRKDFEDQPTPTAERDWIRREEAVASPPAKKRK